MVILCGGELQACPDVVNFKERIVGQDFLPRCTMRQQFEHVLHPQPVPANARTATAFASLNGDTG